MSAALAVMLRRLLLGLPTLVGITLVAFALIHLVPGDPVQAALGERGIDPEQYARLRAQLGLDRPLAAQYGAMLGRLLHGDLGVSLSSNEPVAREFLQHFTATLELSICALALALVLGTAAGIAAALRRGTAADGALMGAALTGYSMPIFWWGLLLIMLFSVSLGLTPVSGRIASAYDVSARTGFMLIDTLLSDEPGALASALAHLVLPVVVLATLPLAVVARMTRSALLEQLHAEHVLAARARGLSRRRVILVHALRSAAIPIITVAGLQVGQLLSGAILTETLFAWPGVGKWLVEAVYRRDYPVVQGAITLIGAAVIAVNAAVDGLCAWVDPRLRGRRA